MTIRPHSVAASSVCLLSAALVLLPIAWLFVGPSVESGTLNLDFLTAVFEQRRLLHALTHTLQASFATAVCATIVGVMLAFLVVRTDIPFRKTDLAADGRIVCHLLLSAGIRL